MIKSHCGIYLGRYPTIKREVKGFKVDFKVLACLKLKNKNESQAVLYAFRFYANHKKKKISLESKESREGKDQRLILRAVDHTLFRLGRKPQGGDMLKIADMVYFADSDKPLKKGDISMRVIKASLSLHYSERQIYYLLKKIRQTFYDILFEFDRLKYD